jgi:hypothetical protein
MAKMLWVGTSSNRKTGNIPQGYVGETRAATEASCDGCPLRKAGCYHWTGYPVAAQSQMQKLHRDQPERYTLTSALNKSRRAARYARGAVGGDPWVFTRSTVQEWTAQIKAAGLRGLIMYTHFARTKASHLKGLVRASADTLEQVDSLVDAGWHTAVILPTKIPTSKRPTLNTVPAWSGESYTTPAGHKVLICPAQTHQGVDCNTCGLCTTEPFRPKVIGFLKH